MYQLSAIDALALVRKNLDEQDPNGSAMYTDENGSSAAYGDNSSLDGIILKGLPEAINAIHKAAPVNLLEGKDAVAGDYYTAASVADGVMSFVLKADTNYLRLVAFRASDSDIVVSDVIPEASPEGRKQLNPHIRGRKDRPRLVQLQRRHTGPCFKYYSCGSTATVAVLIFVQEQFYTPQVGSTEVTYDISRRLRQNIIDYLTAKVMETYGDQRSQAYYQKAFTFPTL